jgi:polygalacturonase
MLQAKWNRRTFLRSVGQGLAAVPAIASFPSASDAQPANASTPTGIAFSMAARVNVRELGASGDGATRDTLALQQALDRCAALGGGEVLVPSGDYLTGPLKLRSHTTLRLEQGASLLGSPDIADYPFTQVRWEGRWIKGYRAFISADDAENISIVGQGRIVASPAIKGRVVNLDGSPVVYTRPAPGPPPRGLDGPANVARQNILRNPALMEFTRCKHVLIQDVVTQGNDMWSTHPVYCQDVTFRNVTIHSGADGIDVDSCKGVVIDGCEFVTRDDCISLKSGRGLEGNTIAIPCEEIRIANCTFNDAVWACIGIGSETSGGIRNVQVERCKCLGAKTFAIYIKSRPGRGAFIENIVMSDLDISGAQQGFLRFNILNSGLQDPDPVPGVQGIPTIRNFRFDRIRVADVPVLVDGASIHPSKPLDGFSLTNVTGTCGKGIFLANIKHAVLRNIEVTGFSGPLLSTYHVTGTGLQGAAPLPEPRLSGPIAPSATPFTLH